MTGFEHAAFTALEKRVSDLETVLRDLLKSQTAHMEALGSLLEIVDLSPGVDPGIIHGINCEKAPHLESVGGYEHSEDDDDRYYLDGLAYCGRCHLFLEEE